MSEIENQHVWAREQMAAALTGGLHGAELARFEVHLAQCVDCNAAWEQLRKADRAMCRQAGRRSVQVSDITLSAGFIDRTDLTSSPP